MRNQPEVFDKIWRAIQGGRLDRDVVVRAFPRGLTAECFTCKKEAPACEIGNVYALWRKSLPALRSVVVQSGKCSNE